MFTSDSLADPQAGHDIQQPRNESNADQPQQPAASNIKATGNNSLQNPIVGIIFYVVTLLSFRWLLLSKHSVIKDKLLKLKRENTLLRKRNEDLEKKIRKLRKLCKCSEPVHKTLLNNENVSFFTNFPSLDVFNAVHDFVVPFVKRRWKGVKRVSSKIKRKFASTAKKFGPARKLPSKDEFLLTLIKLRLGLLAKDLASRFKVSPGLSSQIFTAWLKALSGCLRNLIYVPDEEVIPATMPKRFDSLRNTHSIIDCSEIFLETPKNHILQSVTWSEYKHHNTLKFLVAVAPNSNIIYVSEAYAGKISDKKLTIDSGYLDNVSAYMRVLADKGFNIADEGTARHVFLSVPPGKRGASQFMPSDMKKTSKIAKVCILVEQVI